MTRIIPGLYYTARAGPSEMPASHAVLTPALQHTRMLTRPGRPARPASRNGPSWLPERHGSNCGRPGSPRCPLPRKGLHGRFRNTHRRRGGRRPEPGIPLSTRHPRAKRRTPRIRQREIPPRRPVSTLRHPLIRHPPRRSKPAQHRTHHTRPQTRTTSKIITPVPGIRIPHQHPRHRNHSISLTHTNKTTRQLEHTPTHTRANP